MKSALRLLLALCLFTDAAGRMQAEVTPTEKVVQMLTGMMENGKKEKHDEQVQFAAYKQFCDDTSAGKKSEIDASEELILVLKADIEKYTSDVDRLTKEISEHQADVAAWTGDKAAATKVRKIEKADYDAMHKDYSESIDALGRAIAVMKKRTSDSKQASLQQVSEASKMKLIPDRARKIIEAFLAQGEGDDGLAVSAPEANAYEFQSQHIIDLLEKLLGEFEGEKTKLEKTESNSLHAYEMLMQDLSSQIEYANANAAEKQDFKAMTQKKSADAQGNLVDTTATMTEDQKYLADLEATCAQKSSDFESRQELRSDEIVAIQKAIEILASGSVSGMADKHLPAMLQAKNKKGHSLAQLRSDPNSLVQTKVASFLRQRAKDLNSRVLSMLAAQASADPFNKVKKMINDLIVRLMEEANGEATHKGWCDTELATNGKTRTKKTETVEALHSEIDELEATISKLGQEIAALETGVSELMTAMSEATKIREAEKAKNAQTVADSEEAQQAVAQALTVLKEFYDKAAGATAFVQEKKQTPPEIFDSPYTGQGGAAGGVVGMLEVIQSDFARLEADTKTDEATSQKEYEEFTDDSELDKTKKNKDIEHKTTRKSEKGQALLIAKEDLTGTQKELDTALAYYDKLKPACVDSSVSYSERVAQRKEEIESLQEALNILNGEDLA